MTRPGQDGALEQAMLALTAARPGRNVEPTEVARHVAGPDPELWSVLMPAVRRIAVRLMKEGRLTITRKGRVVDPDDFRGTYRIAAPVESVSGPGNSAPVRPDRR